MGWQLRIASNAAATTWTDLTAAVDRETLRITGQAFDGQIGQGGFDYADDSGAGNVPGLRVFEFKASSGGIVLERGRIGQKDLARGTRHSGDAHQKDVTLWDCNFDLSRIGVHNWARPSETGRARVLACVADFLDGSPRASTVIATTLVRNANTRTMPAKTYDNANPFEVISDCADHEAKIFFVTVDDAGDMDLFYDISSYTGYASGLSITDDTPNLTTEFPPIEAHSTEDPSELFSHVRATYGSGSASVTANNSGVATAHDYMETIYHDSGAVASTAQDLVDRFLDVHDQEEVSRRCSIRIPEASLGDIRHGHTISYRAAATGDLTPVTRRIAQLTWEPPQVEGGDWTAILELDWPLKVGQRYTRPKPPAGTPAPHTDPCEGSDTTPYEDPFDGGPVENDYLAGAGAGDTEWGTDWGPLAWSTGNADAPDPVTIGQDAGRAYVILPVDNGVGTSFSAELQGYTDVYQTVPFRVTMLFDWSIGMTTGGMTLVIGDGNGPGVQLNPAYVFPGILLGALTDGEILVSPSWMVWEYDPDDGEQRVKFWTDGNPEQTTWDLTETGISGYPASMDISVGRGDSAGAPSEVGIRYFLLEAIDPCIDNGPATGQDVGPELVFTGDTITDGGTTVYPYLAGTLRVWLDGVRTFDFTETDPATGAFELDSAPGTGVKVRVEYKGA